MSDAKTVLQMIKDNDVQFVDFRFTDPRGKWQHTAQAVRTIDESVFEDGIMFDGSSIAGWKSIHESYMILMPDPDSSVLAPFAAQPSLVLFCDVVEPSTGQGYGRDPRTVAKKAEAFLKKSAGVFALPMLIEAFNLVVVHGLIKTIIFGTIAKIIGQQLAARLFTFLVGRLPWWVNWIGPAAWTLSIGWATIDIQGPARRKTVPIVLYLGICSMRDEVR